MGIWYYEHPELLGNAATLADVDLVALESFDTRTVGSCSYGRADGGAHVVPLMQNDRVDKVYDRRTGKLKTERRFRAPPVTCSESIAASDSSVDSFADRDAVMTWRNTLIKIVPLTEGAPDAVAAASASATASAPGADAAPPAANTVAAQPAAPPTQQVAAWSPPPTTAAPPPTPTPTPTPTMRRPKIPVLRK